MKSRRVYTSFLCHIAYKLSPRRHWYFCFTHELYEGKSFFGQWFINGWFQCTVGQMKGQKGLSNLCYFLYRGILGGFQPRFRALGCVVNYRFIVLISFLRKCLWFFLKSSNSVNFWAKKSALGKVSKTPRGGVLNVALSVRGGTCPSKNF